MYHYFFFVCFLMFLFGCQVTKDAQLEPEFEYVDNGNAAYGAISGRVVDPETEEPVPFAQVLLEGTTIGANSDFGGQFLLKNVPPGSYKLIVRSPGFQFATIGVEVMAGKTLQINSDIPLEIHEEVLEKPMIYLYPEKLTEISVSLEYEGKLTTTYPKSDGKWKVHANTDGTLIDTTGRKYYGLYWEGIPEASIVPDCGAVVHKDSLISFLETSLSQLGLNYKESNEFIVYWLPRLEQSEYNLIYFAQDEYTDQAVLTIHPKPDTIIRVMMCFTPLKEPVAIAPQTLPSKPERNGFTVVEWGGTECPQFEL